VGISQENLPSLKYPIQSQHLATMAPFLVKTSPERCLRRFVFPAELGADSKMVICAVALCSGIGVVFRRDFFLGLSSISNILHKRLFGEPFMQLLFDTFLVEHLKALRGWDDVLQLIEVEAFLFASQLTHVLVDPKEEDRLAVGILYVNLCDHHLSFPFQWKLKGYIRESFTFQFFTDRGLFLLSMLFFPLARIMNYINNPFRCPFGRFAIL
jgi:hypothetical protein